MEGWGWGYRPSKIEAGVCDKDGYKYYTGTMETGETRDQPAFETTVLCETFPFPVTTLCQMKRSSMATPLEGRLGWICRGGHKEGLCSTT